MLFGNGQGFLDAQLLGSLFRQGNDVASLDLVGGQVDRLAVDGHAAVADQLTGGRTGNSKTHAVDNVVQAGFQQLQQVLAGVALLGRGLLVVVAELTLQQAVDALDLLLFTQLQAVVGSALTGSTAMLTRFGIKLGFVRDRAASALQKQICAFAAGKFGFRADIACHLCSFIY